MNRRFNVGQLVICKVSGVIGNVTKFYKPTASEEQIAVRTADGREYHAPISTWLEYSTFRDAIINCMDSVKGYNEDFCKDSGFNLMRSPAIIIDVGDPSKDLTVFAQHIHKRFNSVK